MSLKFALLGLLSEQPKYGYEIKRRFDGALGNDMAVDEVQRLDVGGDHSLDEGLDVTGGVIEHHDLTGGNLVWRYGCRTVWNGRFYLLGSESQNSKTPPTSRRELEQNMAIIA